MKPMYVKSLVLVAFILMLVWLLFGSEVSTPPESIVKKAQIGSVLDVSPRDLSVLTKAEGVSVARWPITVVASVEGRVVSLPDHSEPGNLLKEGELLLAVEDASYVSNLRAAQARAARAELELAQNKHQKYVATKISKGKKLTAFGRFEPHIRASEADLKAARAEILLAQQKLEDTTVEAPFPAVVIKKMVTPGQRVSSGDQLFMIAGSDSVDINVELSANQWQRIGVMNRGDEVQVEGVGGQRWKAQVRYLSPVMDATTRQRSVTVQIDNPYAADKPLLPGQQVTVIFDSPVIQHVVIAPASVLNQDGGVWSVNDGVLLEEDIELFDEQPEFITFRYKLKPQAPRQLIVYPLSTMLKGQVVETEVVSWAVGEPL